MIGVSHFFYEEGPQSLGFVVLLGEERLYSFMSGQNYGQTEIVTMGNLMRYADAGIN